MADGPTISVILPTRDRPAYLRAAVETVLSQRLTASELLVIDDGTSSPADRVVHSLSPPATVPIRILPGPKRGPAAARNVGLRQAAGELVALLDDDDLWLPQKLEWQARCLAERPRLGVLGTACLRSRDPARSVPRLGKRPRRLRRISRAALLRGNRLTTSSVVARRECFDECGHFDESLLLAQDWDMWLRITAAWEVAVLPARLTTYRLHGNQRSATRIDMRRWEARVMDRALARGDLRGRLAGVARRRLAWARCRLARELARQGDKEGALPEFLQAARSLPHHPAVWGPLIRYRSARRVPAGVGQP